MTRLSCRFCGVEISGTADDLPEGVVRLQDGVAHEACVLVSDADAAVARRRRQTAARQYQQARARIPSNEL